MSEREVKTYCVQCRSLCAVKCIIEDGRLKKIIPDKDHPNGGFICPKGIAAPELVYNQQRLRYPLKRTKSKYASDPGWKRITWAEALNYAASEINKIINEYGSESLVLSRGASGGSPSRDYAPWVFRFANVLNTPNVVTTGHICMWNRDHCTKYTLGIKLPQPDLENTQAVMIWGFNPAQNWPGFYKSLMQATARGAKLIVIDPRKTEIAMKADSWISVNPGKDGLLALSLIHVLINEKLFDRDFVINWTNAPYLIWDDNDELVRGRDLGWDNLDSYAVWDIDLNVPVPVDQLGKTVSDNYALEGTWNDIYSGSMRQFSTVWDRLVKVVSKYSPEKVEKNVSVPHEKITEVARLISENHPVSYYSYNGLEQHTNGTYTNRALCVLYALTGDFDKPGGNVEMPKVPINSLAGDEYLSKEQAFKRLGLHKRPLGPASGKIVSAHDFYDAVLEEEPYPVKGFLSFGGNILLANGDTRKGMKALKALEFYLQTDLFMTPSAQFADLILPASTLWEGWAVRTSFIRSPNKVDNYIQLRQKVINPLYESKPDEQIICDIADILRIGEHFWHGELEKAYDYMLEPTGISVSQLKKQPEGISVKQVQTYRKYEQVGFKTATKRLEIFSTQFKKYGYGGFPEYYDHLGCSSVNQKDNYPLILIGSKVKWYCHSQHRAIPSLRSHYPEPLVEVNPLTSEKFQVNDNEWVYLETPHGRVKFKLKVSHNIPDKIVCVQHGWWQSCPEINLNGYDPFSEKGSNINLIISNNNLDPVSGSAPHKCYPCRIDKILKEDKISSIGTIT